MTGRKSILTTSTGCPIANDDTSISAGKSGPLTFDNFRLIEKLAHFNRERIPERVVHARGSAAYGEFILNNDLSDYTCAKFLNQKGKKTDVFVRFSTVGGGQDSSDYVRDPRGFAVKFYTEDGNYDIVGNNTPVFFINDPAKFPDFVHSQKKDPRTNLPNPASAYEFWANHPQSLHQLTILMSDRGIPYSYRHMNGYGSHTLSLWNNSGERFWVKWHFKTNQGVKTLTNNEAKGLDTTGAQADLVYAIDAGIFPSWKVCLQIMPESEAKEYKVNPFDLTKVWSHSDYPLIEIGELILNRNVENFFAENEQSAFSPGNVVPGVGVSPDKVLQARLIAYPDAQRYRLGANYNQLVSNKPKCPVHNYQRDGAFAGIQQESGNQTSAVNFYPNDRTGSPRPTSDVSEPVLHLSEELVIAAHEGSYGDCFRQAGDLFRIMTDDQKDQLIYNIVDGLKFATDSVQDRMINQFSLADPDYGKRVLSGLEEC
ncbi:MAG: catalase [Pseudomonadales bacterium]|nr:catalase [Pseudomonadales bacterium]